MSYFKQLLQREADTILNMPVHEGDFFLASSIIYSAVHENDKKLVCSGMGKAGQIANNIATTLSSTGTPSLFLHPSEAQHGDIGIVKDGDILLLVSNSGETREILELIKLVHNLARNVKIIGITKNGFSTMAKECDALLLTGETEEICPLGLTPTVSTTCMTVIGDLLVVCMMNQIGFTKKDYSLRHHGGYLGNKSRT